MPLILTDVGALQILKKYFKNVSPAVDNNLKLRLFTNNITPADTHVAADFTEATGGGYALKTILPADWADPSLVSGIATVAAPQQTFSFTGALTAGATIYGYYITDGDTVPNLIYAERAATPYTPATNGDALLITPQFKLSYGTPA